MPLPNPRTVIPPSILNEVVLIFDGAFGADAEIGRISPLSIDSHLADQVRLVGELDLLDGEGTPVARIAPATVTPSPQTDFLVSGPIHRRDRLPRLPYQELRRSRQETLRLNELAGRTAIVRRPLTSGDLIQLHQAQTNEPILLLPLGGTNNQGISDAGLIRSTLAATKGTTITVVPLHLGAYSFDLEQYLLHSYAPKNRMELESQGEVLPSVAESLRAELRVGQDRGVVVLFTGLSGSGKSTIAYALKERIEALGNRVVTHLDGDLVRRILSPNLGFSRDDRTANLRRIGWVAAEIARHGGFVICSPIAPFNDARMEIRQLSAGAGARHVLVHVATPLHLCETRDVKGDYRRARLGDVANFTGVSSPYEIPVDADVTIYPFREGIKTSVDKILEATGGNLPVVKRYQDPGSSRGPRSQADTKQNEKASS